MRSAAFLWTAGLSLALMAGAADTPAPDALPLVLTLADGALFDPAPESVELLCTGQPPRGTVILDCWDSVTNATASRPPQAPSLGGPLDFTQASRDEGAAVDIDLAGLTFTGPEVVTSCGRFAFGVIPDPKAAPARLHATFFAPASGPPTGMFVGRLRLPLRVRFTPRQGGAPIEADRSLDAVLAGPFVYASDAASALFPPGTSRFVVGVTLQHGRFEETPACDPGATVCAHPGPGIVEALNATLPR